MTFTAAVAEIQASHAKWSKYVTDTCIKLTFFIYTLI